MSSKIQRIDWTPSRFDFDAEISDSAPVNQGRALNLFQNNSIAKGIIQTKSDYVIGSGLKLTSAIDHDFLSLNYEKTAEYNRIIHKEWGNFTAELDVSGVLSFGQMQSAYYKSKLILGNAIAVMLRTQKETKYGYKSKLQIVDAQLLSNPNYRPDTSTLLGGIEQRGGVVQSYYFEQAHSNSNILTPQSNTWVKYDRIHKPTNLRNVLHYFQADVPAQLRGASELEPIFLILKQLESYLRSTLTASELSAQLFAFITSEDGELNFDDQENRNEYEIDGIKSTSLATGEKIEFSNPSHPQSTVANYFESIMKMIAAATGLPVSIILKSFDSSYSSNRFAHLDLVKMITKERTQFINAFLNPLYDHFLFQLALSGRIPMPGFFADTRVAAAWSQHSFSGEGMGSLNPLNDLKTSLLAHENNLMSRQQIMDNMNGANNFEDLQPILKREADLNPPPTEDV